MAAWTQPSPTFSRVSWNLTFRTDGSGRLAFHHVAAMNCFDHFAEVRPSAQMMAAVDVDSLSGDPARFVADQEVRKTIVVPGRLVNIVV